MPPLLSVAAPEAFGFLDKHNDITINGGRLQVAEGQELVVIGGDIRMSTGDLYAPRGHIKLVSAASAGEVKLSNVMEDNTFTQFGRIKLENTFLDVNAQTAEQGKSGSIMILGGQFFLTGQSQIQTLSHTGTGNIEIQSTGQLQITDNSKIHMLNRGDGGEIILTGQTIQLSNGGIVLSETLGQGQGGDIVLESTQLDVTGTASIGTSSLGKGKGGSLSVKAQKMKMDDGLLQVVTFGNGNAGNIDIQANNLKLANGAQINASSEGSGQGGHITVNVKDKIDITGYFGNLDENNINPSGIASSAFSSGDSGTIQISALSLNLDNLATIQTLTKCEGKSGNISIDVNELRIMGGADIDASNEGTGIDKGGNITITATDSVLITATPGEDEDNQFVVETGFLGGIYSSANKNGAGGDITLSTRKLTMRNGGVISAGSEGTGNAGNLLLNIGEELNLDNAAILTRAQKAGGGNMTFHINERLDLFNSQISAEAKGENELHQGGNLTIYPINLIHLYKSQIFTDGYTGNGGSLTIKKANFMTLNQSKIFTGAVSGDGGNINITANHFLRSSDSVLDASSELGLDGDIIINAPDIDLTGSLAILPKTFIDASQLLLKNCSNQINPNKNFFKLLKRSGLPEVFQSGHGSKLKE